MKDTLDQDLEIGDIVVYIVPNQRSGANFSSPREIEGFTPKKVRIAGKLIESKKCLKLNCYFENRPDEYIRLVKK